MARTIRVVVTGVASSAATAWIHSTQEVLHALREHAETVPFVVPTEILDTLSAYLDQWSLAALGDSFRWSGEIDAEQVRRLVTYCLNLAMLSDESLRALDCERMPSVAGEFHEALGRALVDALAAAPETASFAARLAALWPGGEAVGRPRTEAPSKPG